MVFIFAQLLHAAAFQDHFARSLKLNAINNVKHQTKQKKKQAAAVGPGDKDADSTGDRTSTNTTDTDNIDDQQHRQRLTLAQRLGLVAAPPPRQSLRSARAAARQRGDRACPVCREPFLQAVDTHNHNYNHNHNGRQLLLSCSHTFHHACLRSWERHVGGRVCPVCRGEDYVTTVISDGANYARAHAATVMQAAWRGFLARVRFQRLLASIPPKSPSARRVFFANKLEGLNNALLHDIQSERSEYDALVAEMDAAIAHSHCIYRLATGHADSPPCSPDALPPVSPTPPSPQRVPQDTIWTEAAIKAVERGAEDCPICLIPLDTPASGHVYAANTDDSNLPQHRSIALLTCSHVFHSQCIANFEAFTKRNKGDRNVVGSQGSNSSISSHLACPVCRAAYQRSTFV
eukprot:jgi/Chlat1/2008/Chrsp158S02319